MNISADHVANINELDTSGCSVMSFDIVVASFVGDIGVYGVALYTVNADSVRLIKLISAKYEALPYFYDFGYTIEMFESLQPIEFVSVKQKRAIFTSATSKSLASYIFNFKGDMLVIPITNKEGNVIGILEYLGMNEKIYNSEKGKISLPFINLLATMYINNEFLKNELQLSRYETITKLSVAAEFRDEDTGFHLKRMSRYSAIIAARYGKKDDYVELILHASPMHDIGKIGVPDSILHKPGPLNDDEWKIMQMHTIYGALIIGEAKDNLFDMGKKIALYHHEKWDGSGYPYGFSAKQIPMCARIVAVADVFDALTSKRPYKDAYEFDRSINIIKEGRGKHFDPDVVDAFILGIDEIYEVYARYQKEPLVGMK